jgi:hypothetical protein
LRTDSAFRPDDSTARPARLARPPRRAVATILATVLGLVLLFSFKTPDAPPTSSRPLAVAIGSRSPSPTPQPSPSGSASPGEASPTPSPSSTPSPTSGGQQFDGDVVFTQFGDIQVRVVESGGRIVDVQALQLPFDRRRSFEISQFVGPILQSEALQAQSAQIDTVSGATYTSDAYRSSLQSALDLAHG